jgi:hypothetical protein
VVGQEADEGRAVPALVYGGVVGADVAAVPALVYCGH